MSLLDRLKAFFRLGVPPPAPRRLDGRSEALLAASFDILPDEEPGWITMREDQLGSMPFCFNAVTAAAEVRNFTSALVASEPWASTGTPAT
jgi:hypothetical protein